ncbi:MAG TPA: BON domain-containing protein [Candidatus Eisenbacteria bacterium]
MSRSLMAAMLALSTMAVACSNSNHDAAQNKAPDYSQNQPANTQADNTAQNKVDQTNTVPEPMDQGTSDVDMTITTVLRKAITSDESLSMNAKNVKIITRDGVVTLRGPVETTAERAAIEAAANAVSGVRRVDSYLEVTGG